MLPADTGLADPRAYVRLAAIVRQQIIDRTLEREQPAESGRGPHPHYGAGQDQPPLPAVPALTA